MRLMISARELAYDPEVASWLFETAAVDDSADPIVVLMQHELEDDFDEDTQPMWAALHN